MHVFRHVTATGVGAARQVELVTDMPPPLVATPASLSPELERTEGTGASTKFVYCFGLAPGQAILLQVHDEHACSPGFLRLFYGLLALASEMDTVVLRLFYGCSTVVRRLVRNNRRDSQGRTTGS